MVGLYIEVEAQKTDIPLSGYILFLINILLHFIFNAILF